RRPRRQPHRAQGCSRGRTTAGEGAANSGEGAVSLAGKTLFITGASRGIGLAIALRAARDGANIAIAAKTTEPHARLAGTLHSAADQIERRGGQAVPLAVDVTGAAG